jgi:hypothetical protein
MSADDERQAKERKLRERLAALENTARSLKLRDHSGLCEGK